MLKNLNVTTVYHEGVCVLRLTLPPQNDGFQMHGCGSAPLSDEEGAVGGVTSCTPEATGTGRRVENIRNCDIFIGDNNFLLYVDVCLLQFHNTRQFDLTNMKKVYIRFDSKERFFEIVLPCRNWTEVKPLTGTQIIKTVPQTWATPALEKLSSLQRITGSCWLVVDNAAPVRFVADFGFGFASMYKESLLSPLGDVSTVTRVWQPHITSPLQRAVWREQAEKKDFSSDSYKLNCIELQLPDGHENPFKFTLVNLFQNVSLTKEQENLLHNITLTKLVLPHSFSQTEIECGLISIVLAICYDVRTTYNDPTCESGWTRTILSSALSYFEEFTSVREVVHVFLRRSLIYPLYRNFELGRRCVIDAMSAFQHPNWIMQQLLVTHQLFETSDEDRRFLNRYFIEDYIRYMNTHTTKEKEQLTVISENIKNVVVDLKKKNLRLDLIQHERDMLRELCPNLANPATSNQLGEIFVVHTDNDEDEDEESSDIDGEEEEEAEEEDDEAVDGDDEGDDEEEDSCVEDEDGEDADDDEIDIEAGDETFSSSPSETEENSVIEQLNDIHIENKN